MPEGGPACVLAVLLMRENEVLVLLLAREKELAATTLEAARCILDVPVLLPAVLSLGAGFSPTRTGRTSCSCE